MKYGCMTAFVIITFAILFDLFVTWIIQLLYNELIAPAFSWHEVSYWVVFAIIVILSIVGSFFKN